MSREIVLKNHFKHTCQGRKPKNKEKGETNKKKTVCRCFIDEKPESTEERSTPESCDDSLEEDYICPTYMTTTS